MEAARKRKQRREEMRQQKMRGGKKVRAKGGRTSKMDHEDKLQCRGRRGERCKVVNERGFCRFLRLYKVGSEGLTEVL